MVHANYSYGVAFGESPTREAVVRGAASTYMLMEYGMYNFHPNEIKNPSAMGGSYYMPGVGLSGRNCATVHPEFRSDCQTGRHFEGITIGFADGHVKWLKGTTVFSEAMRFSDTDKTKPCAFDPKANN